MSWRRFFLRKRSDAELQQEINAYLEEESAENLARGMSPEEARRRARIKLGNPLVIRETLWKQNTIAVLDGWVRDFRYALRTLSRSRGFAVIAVLVMALGIGVNVALFTVVHGILLEPQPYRDSDQLVTVYERDSRRPRPDPFMPVAGGSFAQWQRAEAGTAQMAMVSPWQANQGLCARQMRPSINRNSWGRQPLLQESSFPFLRTAMYSPLSQGCSSLMRLTFTMEHR